MQPTHTDDETAQGTQPRSRARGRLILLVALLLVLLLIIFVPPLINVSRLQQRIAANISAALGRPVHFDHVTLTLFPLPGFTLEGFVIDEDPAFGYEPILRADQVQVTLRISSLWHSHTEFSKISFTEPSVNLVHTASGHWNIETLLLQASHLQAAPTSQRFAGPARRFPYIEATGARLNLKLDQAKSPFSLTDTDFALWLPEPHQWHLRLEAHPTRTDTTPGDTGTVRLEGTLGGADLNASSLDQIPIDLRGNWQDAQLGGLSRLALGDDRGLRGDFSLNFRILGTVAHNAIATDIKLAKARRAAFVPDHMLSLEATCNANATGTFHSFSSIECHWPPAGSSDPSILILTASVPDVADTRSATATITLPALPSNTFFDWLSVASPHPPTGLAGAGTLAGTLTWQSPVPAQPGSFSGDLEFSGGSLAIDPASNRSIPLGDVIFRSTPPAAPAPSRHHAPAAIPVPGSFDLLPVTLALGGKQPATLEGHFDPSGYTLHLTGTVIPARLLELGTAVPQLGDGLQPALDEITGPASNPDAKPASDANQAPIHIDLTATRAWGGPQTWSQTTPPASHPRAHSRR